MCRSAALVAIVLASVANIRNRGFAFNQDICSDAHIEQEVSVSQASEIEMNCAIITGTDWSCSQNKSRKGSGIAMSGYFPAN